MTGQIVVALKGIVIWNRKILIVRRSADDAIGSDTWECPGGKLEFGEDLVSGLCREIQEETGLAVQIGKLAYATTFRTSENRQIVLLVYYCLAESPHVRLSGEHSDFLWANRQQIEEKLDPGILADFSRYGVTHPSGHDAATLHVTEQENSSILFR
jgi:8-oxo-dGTP diphosphatase